MSFDQLLHTTANTLDGYASLTTVMRVPALEAWAGDVGNSIGFAPDKFKYALGMLLGYPLAFVFAVLPFGFARHAFSLLTGVFLAQFVLGSGWIHSLVSASIVYFIIAATSGIKAMDKYRHIIVFVFMMGYMTASHIYRIYVDYMGWSLDFTGPQMLLTIKLTSMAYSLYDGTVDAKRLKSELADESTDKRRRKLYQGRVDRSISKLPNLVEYFGYVYCFTTYLAGPAFGIEEYLAVCNGTKFTDKTTPPPSRAFDAIKCCLSSFVFVGLMVWGESNFPISRAYDKEWLANTAYASWSGWFYHFFCVWAALFFIRAKYYFGWLLSEGSSIVSGFGYDFEKKNWRGQRNIDWFAFETAQSVRAGSRAWNQRTQVWLENCVYARTNNSLVATYFVSAFWHGFYPGYYLFFLSVPLATSVNRLAFKKVRPMFMQSDGKTPGSNKWLYDIASWLATTFCMNYLATVFQMLSWERSVIAWRAMYGCGHIGMIVLYIVFAYGLKSPKKKQK